MKSRRFKRSTKTPPAQILHFCLMVNKMFSKSNVKMLSLVFPLPPPVFLSQQAEGAVVEPTIPRPHLHQGL